MKEIYIYKTIPNVYNSLEMHPVLSFSHCLHQLKSHHPLCSEGRVFQEKELYELYFNNVAMYPAMFDEMQLCQIVSQREDWKFKVSRCCYDFSASSKLMCLIFLKATGIGLTTKFELLHTSFSAHITLFLLLLCIPQVISQKIDSFL